MANKKIAYAHAFNVNFGLYAIEGIDFEKSKIEIQREFEEQKVDGIKKALATMGLQYEGLNYYSPRAYNFDNDDMTLFISVVDKNLLRLAILKHENIINQNLAKNKSYDGYIATTVSSVAEELWHMTEDYYEPDVIVLATLLKIYYPEIDDFDPSDYFVPDEEEE